MWPMRTRRGTRKRCAALFCVSACAAIVVLMRPFVSGPLRDLDESIRSLEFSAAASVYNNGTAGVGSGGSAEGLFRPSGAGMPAALQSSSDATPDVPPSAVPVSTSERTNNRDSSTNVATSKVVPAAVVMESVHPFVAPVPLVANGTTVVAVAASGASEEKAPPGVARPSNETGGAAAAARSGRDDNNGATVLVSDKKLRPLTGGADGATTSTTAGSPAKVTTTTIRTVPTSEAAPENRSLLVESGLADAGLTAAAAAVAPATSNVDPLPTIYVVTPTFPRMEQIPELTRLGQTLMHVPSLFWIVADDAPKKSPAVTDLLDHLRLNYTYILGAMPDSFRKKKGSKPKGVANRMAGLQWIQKNAASNGVMFFADDDNSYDIRLFEEMRFTKKVSMWPVGLVTQLGVSTPVVRNGKVIDFYDGWIANRKFPVDMAGFAVNVGFLKSRPKAAMPFKAGFEEDGFLRSLNISINDIEPKANNCTKLYVWHTRTVSNKPPQKLSTKDRQKFKNTNLFLLPHIV